tara:strand:- start:323 stop:544 length:222 start_codon:yes stop_codon:yes gene_type:complete
MIIELYEDVKQLDKAKHNLILALNNRNSNTTKEDIKNAFDIIAYMISSKENEITKIQDEHNRRSLEDLLGRKI